MSTYYDAVLDNNMQPVFNGTPQETREWLLQRPDEHKDWQICPGYRMRLMTVQDYLDH